jgi:hypothetical protein
MKFFLCIVTMVVCSYAIDRDSIGTMSLVDSKWNLAVGADDMLTLNKFYPTAWADLYIYCLGIRVNYGPIINFAHSDINNRFNIGSNLVLGLETRIIFRIKDEFSFFRFLIFEPSLLAYDHELNILGEETYPFNYTTAGLKIILASSGCEVYLQPQYVVSKDQSLNMSNFLMSIGIDYRFKLSDN